MTPPPFSAALSRFLVVAAVTAAASGLMGAVPAAAAEPAGTVDYVALGDSYAAGVGAGPEKGPCRVSDGAYPQLWAASDPGTVSLTSAACSGAVTADVRAKQLGSLGDDTDLVSITIGGNDLGLIGAVRLCADQGQAKACRTKLAAINKALDTTLPRDLTRTLAAVAKKAPNAKLAIVGYPMPFADVADCSSLPLSRELRDAGNEAVAGVNRILAARAAALRATYVDAARPYTGHGLCSASPWLVGAEGLAAQTVLHPTLQGQTAGQLSALRDGVGTPKAVLAWIAERDRPAAGPSPAAPSAAAAPADGDGSPATAAGLWWIAGAALVLLAAGILAYRRLRPRGVAAAE
ncbi:SGNH/GDSL hydrolase family protein [Actinoplanes sp. NPDC049118]|uniref:SGNH/GDSL hydrolase family protein n=1 Tax=Actinoplanes sp. NPDC049118 TaxID=3155769 RepID=UPI0033D69B32